MVRDLQLFLNVVELLEKTALPGDLSHRSELCKEGEEASVKVGQSQRTDQQTALQRGKGRHLSMSIGSMGKTNDLNCYKKVNWYTSRQ